MNDEFEDHFDKIDEACRRAGLKSQEGVVVAFDPKTGEYKVVGDACRWELENEDPPTKP